MRGLSRMVQGTGMTDMMVLPPEAGQQHTDAPTEVLQAEQQLAAGHLAERQCTACRRAMLFAPPGDYDWNANPVLKVRCPHCNAVEQVARGRYRVSGVRDDGLNRRQRRARQSVMRRAGARRG